MSPFEVKVKMTPFQTNSKVIFSQSFIKIFDLIRNMDTITGWQILTPFEGQLVLKKKIQEASPSKSTTCSFSLCSQYTCIRDVKFLVTRGP